MKLTKNFYLNEFASRDGSETPCEVAINLKELAMNLQVLRDETGQPVIVTSGYRSLEWNRIIGSNDASQHPLGKAGDIKIGGWTPMQIAAKIEELIKAGKMKQGGLGIYRTFVHYDIRGTKARW